MQDEETVGQAAEVDLHVLGEAGPEAVGEGFDGGLAEEVTPMALVFFCQHGAGFALGAGGGDLKVAAQCFALGDELAAGGVVAGLDVKDLGGGTKLVGEGLLGFVAEFVESVADEHDGVVGNRRITGGGGCDFDRKRGVGFADHLLGEAAGEGGVVPELNLVKGVDSEALDKAKGGDAGAAAPVEDFASLRLESGLGGELEGAVPLPADAGGEGGVVVGEVVFALPIDAGVICAVEEAGA